MMATGYVYLGKSTINALDAFLRGVDGAGAPNIFGRECGLEIALNKKADLLAGPPLV
jgi:hypothetical protein